MSMWPRPCQTARDVCDLNLTPWLPRSCPWVRAAYYCSSSVVRGGAATHIFPCGLLWELLSGFSPAYPSLLCSLTVVPEGSSWLFVFLIFSVKTFICWYSIMKVEVLSELLSIIFDNALGHGILLFQIKSTLSGSTIELFFLITCLPWGRTSVPHSFSWSDTSALEWLLVVLAFWTSLSGVVPLHYGLGGIWQLCQYSWPATLGVELLKNGLGNKKRW